MRKWKCPYNAKVEGYTTIMGYMNELGDIVSFGTPLFRYPKPIL